MNNLMNINEHNSARTESMTAANPCPKRVYRPLQREHKN